MQSIGDASLKNHCVHDNILNTVVANVNMNQSLGSQYSDTRYHDQAGEL